MLHRPWRRGHSARDEDLLRRVRSHPRPEVAKDLLKPGASRSFSPNSVAKSLHFATLRDRLTVRPRCFATIHANFATESSCNPLDKPSPSQCILIGRPISGAHRAASLIRREVGQHRDDFSTHRDGLRDLRDGMEKHRDGLEIGRDALRLFGAMSQNFATVLRRKGAKRGYRALKNLSSRRFCSPAGPRKEKPSRSRLTSRQLGQGSRRSLSIPSRRSGETPLPVPSWCRRTRNNGSNAWRFPGSSLSS